MVPESLVIGPSSVCQRPDLDSSSGGLNCNTRNNHMEAVLDYFPSQKVVQSQREAAGCKTIILTPGRRGLCCFHPLVPPPLCLGYLGPSLQPPCLSSPITGVFLHQKLTLSLPAHSPPRAPQPPDRTHSPSAWHRRLCDLTPSSLYFLKISSIS